MSGYFMEKGISLANVKEKSLREIITKSDYCDIATAPLLSLIIKNDKCASCKYIKACAGGCPALGLLYSNPPGNMFHEDVTKCVFFENGWYDRVLRAMDDWKVTNPLNI
jgi:radical SAM protein with 4Fe4S-binding SPASM domain